MGMPQRCSRLKVYLGFLATEKDYVVGGGSLLGSIKTCMLRSSRANVAASLFLLQALRLRKEGFGLRRSRCWKSWTNNPHIITSPIIYPLLKFNIHYSPLVY